MAGTDKEVNNFLEKVKNAVKEGGLDLSSDEDLSIGIMTSSVSRSIYFLQRTRQTKTNIMSCSTRFVRSGKTSLKKSSRTLKARSGA